MAAAALPHSGTAGGGWTPFYELSAVGIDGLMPGTPETNPDKEYFRSDYKQRGKGVWQHLTTLDKGESQCAA